MLTWKPCSPRSVICHFAPRVDGVLFLQVKHVNQDLPNKEKMQVVAMSATVGNLKELSTFLDAELFTEDFRPVKLVEHVVVGSDILEVRGTGASVVEER